MSDESDIQNASAATGEPASKKRPAPIVWRPPAGLSEEFARRVDASGLSRNAFITKMVLGVKPPRAARRPAIEHQMIGHLLSQIARLDEDLQEMARMTGSDGGLAMKALMIPFASQRGGGADLATHLQNAADNEHVEVADIRGAVAKDLHGAFAEWEAIAHCLTRCEKYLYSLSINPWDKVNGQMSRGQYRDYIDRVEDRLGLAGQPRAVVFHIKEGREHAHVVWSRIDAPNEKAIQLSFDRQKLMMVTREFARDHDLILPDGYHREGADKGKHHQATLYDMHQQRETGLTKQQRMEEITRAWKQSDSPQAFVNALSEKGYILARGDRPYVVVDMYGHVSALPRMIDDRNVRAKDVRAFLEKDFPSEELPSIEEAKDYAKEFRDQIKGHKARFELDEKKAHLERLQKDRRAGLERERDELRATQQAAREALAGKQQSIRDELDFKHAAQDKTVAEKRAWFAENGKASNFVRISGVAVLREKWHSFLDERRHAKQQTEKDDLIHRQQIDAYNLEADHFWPSHVINRRFKALDKIEARERASLNAAYVRAQKLALRKGHEHMPSLGLHLSPPGRGARVRPAWHHYRAQVTKKVIDQGKARDDNAEIDVADEFDRAARRAAFREQDSGQGEKEWLKESFDKAASSHDDNVDHSDGDAGQAEAPDMPDIFARAAGRGHAREEEEFDLTGSFDRASGADELYGDEDGDDDLHPDDEYGREQAHRPVRKPRGPRER
ncbi:unnamed protein product [Symbiodinium microadriaticum]|nr:unnamed protein product [Symbiodinium microadriaticum]